MQHPPIPARSRKRLIASGLSIYVLLAMVAVAGLWTVRSYALDRDRDDQDVTVHGFDDEETNQFSYALIGGEHATAVDVNRDWKEIQRLGRKYGKDVFWFSIDDDEYVVVDDDVIDRAKDIVEPMTKLGAEQGRIGAIQGRLGAKQGSIGAKQGKLGAKQGLLAARLAMTSSDRDEDERQAIEDELDAIGRQMEELGRMMEPLGREQGELGRQQGVLGEKMGKLSKRVKVEMRELADDSIKNGKARRVD